MEQKVKSGKTDPIDAMEKWAQAHPYITAIIVIAALLFVGITGK